MGRRPFLLGRLPCYRKLLEAVERLAMMLLIFAVLALAFALAWLNHTLLARLAAGLCFALAIKLFLWEIYSPEYGFAMPWLQG